MLAYYYGSKTTSEAMENKDGNVVSKRITNKLVVKQPGTVLVDQYLVEICKAYGVTWAPGGAEELGSDGEDGGGLAVGQLTSAFAT